MRGTARSNARRRRIGARQGRRVSEWERSGGGSAREHRGAFAKLRGYVEEAGRDPSTIGLEVWVSTGEGGPAEWRDEFLYWKGAGVTHVTLNNTYARGPHRRIAGRTVADHLQAMKQYRTAVADLL